MSRNWTLKTTTLTRHKARSDDKGRQQWDGICSFSLTTVLQFMVSKVLTLLNILAFMNAQNAFWGFRLSVHPSNLLPTTWLFLTLFLFVLPLRDITLKQWLLLVRVTFWRLLLCYALAWLASFTRFAMPMQHVSEHKSCLHVYSFCLNFLQPLHVSLISVDTISAVFLPLHQHFWSPYRHID